MSTGPKHLRLKLSLLLNFFVLAILLNSVGAVTLQVQRSFGVAPSAAGMLAVFKSIGIVAASFLAMIYLTRIGYRRTMLYALGTLTVVCAIVPSVPDFLMMKLLFIAAGAGFAAIKVSVYSTIGLVTDGPKAHASFMSFLESFFTFGLVAGYFLFSAFTNEMDPQSHDWLRVFYVLAALSALAWCLLLGVALDETRVRSDHRWQDHLRIARRVGLTEIVLLFGACVFLYVMIEQSTLNWLPTFNSNVLHLPVRLSLQLAGLLTVALALGRLAGGFILRRIAWLPVLATCLVCAMALVVVGLSLTGAGEIRPAASWSAAPAAAFLFPLIGFFVSPIYSAINSVVLSATPLEEHAPMSSIGVIFSACGSSLGTLGLGYLFDAYGGRSAFYFSLLPMALLLGCLLVFDRRSKRAARPPPAVAAAKVAGPA